MPYSSLAQRAAVVRAVETIPFPIAEFSSRDPSQFTSCRSWLQLEAWTNHVGLRSEAADPLLAWLLRRVRDQPAAYQEVLLLVAMRELHGILSRLHRLDPDPWSLWSNITWSFLRAARRLDCDRRTQFLGRKLVNDTQHVVRQKYARDRQDDEWFLEVVPNEDDDQGGLSPDDLGVDDPAFDAVDLKLDAARMQSLLRGLVRAGHLSRTDYLILIGCHYYGRSLENMAARLGLSYEGAKKRRQRATKNLQEIANCLSPAGGETPL